MFVLSVLFFIPSLVIYFLQVSALKNNSAPFQVRASPVKVVEKAHASAVAPESAVQSVPSGNKTAEKISGQAGGFILGYASEQ